MKKFNFFCIFVLLLGMLFFPLSAKAASQSGVGVIGYGDAYTRNRIISVTETLNNNNRYKIYYNVYSSTMYLDVLTMGSSVKTIKLNSRQIPLKTTTLAGTTVYQIDNLDVGKNVIKINEDDYEEDYKSNSSMIYINFIPNVEVYSEQLDVDCSKDFTIRFNQKIKNDGRLDDYVKVVDESGNYQNVYISLKPDDYSINIYPSNSYQPNKNYTLRILPGIKSIYGKVISHETVMRFNTKHRYNILKDNSNLKEDLFIKF